MASVIISDTSCLIALDRVDQLHILQQAFSIVYTTAKVQEEFEKALPAWIVVKTVNDQAQLKKLELLLDAGEASAITLALETPNSVLIIDEKKGRKIASDLHLDIIGTLKVLLIAKEKGIIVSVKQIIEQLNQRSFRFSKALVTEVLKLAGEDR